MLGGGALPRADLLRWRIEAGTARAAEGAFDGSVVAGGGGAVGPTATAAVDTVVAGPPALVGAVHRQGRLAPAQGRRRCRCW